MPTILPSYNQIGFDSVHYLVGLVGSPAPGRAWAWAIGGRPTNAGTVVDAASRVRFPLLVSWEGDMLTLDNQVGFGIDFNGFTLPFSRFRVAGTITAEGAGAQAFGVFAQAICGQIDFYGTFLRQLGFCNPESDILAAAGAVELLTISPRMEPPSGIGAVSWSRQEAGDEVTITARLAGSALVASEHNLGVLVVDGAGAPLRCENVEQTTVEVDADGHPSAVSVVCPASGAAATQAWLMVDTSAVAHTPSL